MKGARMGYLTMVFETGLGYSIEVTRSGAVYYRMGRESLRRANSIRTRQGIGIEGPDGTMMTVNKNGKLIIGDRVIERQGTPKEKEETEDEQE